jgi:3-hydroxyacyl-[acyl-carrier-protein] dehydratase
MAARKEWLDIIDLQRILPHRYPFMMVDRLTKLPPEHLMQIEPGMKVAGIKNVTSNEPYFAGHFPGNPIMPGVMIVECMAQVACAAGLMLRDNIGKLGLFTGIDEMKFRRLVIPGDTLLVEAEFLAFRRSMGKVLAKATVDGVVAAEGIIRFALVDPPSAMVP